MKGATMAESLNVHEEDETLPGKIGHAGNAPRIALNANIRNNAQCVV